MRAPRFRDWPSRWRALPLRRRKLLRVVAAVLLAAVLFGAGVLAGRLSTAAHGAAAREADLAEKNDALQNQLAILQRDRQVSQIADRVLQKNLAERDEEIRSLRADQAFYSKLVGADARPGGLTVHGLTLTPLAKTHAWNFTVTLTHSAEGAKEIQGTLSLAVEGVRADKLATLDWPTLAGANAGTGLPFDFKYFQQVQGTLMLPVDFTPNRVRVTLQPQGGEAVMRTLAWDEVVQSGASGAP
ncbi:MAG TPA: DUF6776 family protein [Rhodanobacteraceae bacterium]|nr:DUF6776 family protein [Rhodanobacteraceae bacterium]